MSAAPDWLKPLTWIDPADYIDILGTGGERRESEEGYQRRKRRVYDFLADYEKRPTDLWFMLSGFLAAHKAANPDRPLTSRQVAAIEARSEAWRRGIIGQTEMHIFVGHELGIARENALQLLQRADARLDTQKIIHNSFSPAYIVERVDKNRERSIQRMIASLTHECPSAGMSYCQCTKNPDYQIMGKYEFCLPCYDIWCRQRSRAEWPAWLVFRNNEIRADLRRRAIEALDYAELEELDI